MPLAFFVVLLFASPGAHATGSPSVLYLMGGEFLILLATLVWAAVAPRPWAKRGRAIACVLMGLAAVIALNAVPDYRARQALIDGASAICVVFTVAMVFRCLGRD